VSQEELKNISDKEIVMELAKIFTTEYTTGMDYIHGKQSLLHML
jgi:hypothetical protein